MPFPLPPNSFWAIPPGHAEQFQSPAMPTDQYDSITVAATPLAGSDTVQLRVVVPNGTATPDLVQVCDIYGTAINLNATTLAIALEGGPSYVAIKDATTSGTPAAVVWTPKLA